MWKIFVILLILFCQDIPAQTFYNPPLAHTYSIVAVDSVTGEIGAAVQSHWFSVGSNVIWAEAGVGAVATQSFINVSFGPRGLQLLKEGNSPEQALKILIDSDEGRDYRQLAIIDAAGNSVAYTGKKCIAEAGNINKKYYSVQANLMLNDKVWPAMKKAFLATKAPLAERLIAALEAAEGEGGDIRGRQSAAVLVVKAKSSGKLWEDRLIDLRVEDHPQPVQELKRVLRVFRAYEHMNAGDLAIEKGDEQGALREYGAAEEMFPENLEMKYWHAVSLANMGELDVALPLFREVFEADRNWKILTPRLVPSGLLKVTEQEMKRIIMGNVED
ncbi:MAG: Zn-dependent protease [Gammaproteobacteria bacterium SG8_11]|nr:MAG: Zn-dependent protease [Gammaproteobacteria bacterium SG8_11]